MKMSQSIWRKACEKLLLRSLQIRKEDRLLMFWDESFEKYLPSLTEAICQLNIRGTLIHLPIAYQRHLIRGARGGDRVELPSAYQAAVTESTAIITVLSGEQETSRLRGALIGLTRPKGCRLAHIPGISDEVLEIIEDSPFDEIIKWSNEIAWAMGEARKAEIQTVDKGGHVHILGIPLDGWDNEPLLSTGVIGPDSWGNVPPAEVFCCPPPMCAEGTYVVNGSIQGHVFDADEEVLLTFRKGRLEQWSGDPASLGYQFFEQTSINGKAAQDGNWNVLAELGIGLNPAAHLTGNSLLDEKVLGTMHVAIGDNFHFGYSVKSGIHEDVVTRNPSIFFDGHCVMRRGEICSAEIARWRDASLADSPLILKGTICLRRGRASVKNGILHRRVCRGQRSGEIPLADSVTGSALAKLYGELVTYGDDIDVCAFVGEHKQFDGIPSPKLLGILRHVLIVE